MSRALVQYQEKDLSAYVSENSTINVGFILPVNKGKRNKVLQFTSAEQLLAAVTKNNSVEIGTSLSIFSALRIVKKSTLYVVIPQAAGCLYSALKLTSNSLPATLAQGISDPTTIDFNTNPCDAVIYAASQGDHGNSIRIRVLNYKEPDKVISSKVAGASASFKLTTTQTWCAGFPVTVYGDTVVDPNLTYFIAPDKTDPTSYLLYTSQANAIAGTSPLAITSLKVGTIISPAVQFTKIKDTSVIQVFTNSSSNPTAEYVVSLSENKRSPDGDNLFIEEVLRDTPYVEVSYNPASSGAQLFEFVTPVALSGGSNGTAVTTGDMIKSVRYLESVNDVNITLVSDGGYTVPAFQQRLEQLCKNRGDCFPVLSAPLSAQKNPDTSAQEVVNYRRYDLNIDSSWAALYAPHIKIYDEFNDREVWAAPDGFVIEQILATAANYELWYPVAGNKRGKITALDTKVHYQDGDQDLLYDNGINPIIFSAGKGIRIWGQKTLQSQPSMLDRLNVRLMMITIGPAITEFLRDYLFDFNDAATRAEAKSKLENYLEGIKGRRGISFYAVVCDETNNSSQDIDEHKMNIWAIICPNNSIERIVFPIALVNNSAKLENVYQQI